ncbi:MAG: plastocyanin [Cyanobacteria bacterium P01_F01_bin.143]
MLKKLSILFSTLLLVVGSFFVTVSPALASTYEVKMGTDSFMLQFDPSTITIKAGDTVKWVNNKMSPHNLVFDDSSIESHKGLLFAAGDSVQNTFTEPGTYSYYCEPHRGAGMLGFVIVE